MTPPLNGIRVLDFGRYIAGPYCAALLAEYGADVIRIEKRDGSEDRWNVPVGDGGDGALFLQMNRNKRSLTLDPMTPGGREVIDRLLPTADVVVANLPTQALERMGIDYERLSSINPRIILTTVSAYGPTGPMSRNVGFDGVGQVMTGGVYMTGTPEQPYRAMVPWVDFGTALHCPGGTLIALKERETSGRGQIVRGTLLGTALTYNNALLIEQAVLGVDRIATGNRGQTSAPNDLFRTRDGWVVCQVIGQPLYERWAKLMGEAHWLTDPRFKDDRARGDNGAVVSERMSRWCAERTSDEVIEILGKAMIPCGPVLAPQQTLDHPQVAALGLLEPLEYPGLPRPAPVGRVPVTLSRTECVERTPPPVLGADSDAVLREIGYDDAAIEQLRAKKAV